MNKNHMTNELQEKTAKAKAVYLPLLLRWNGYDMDFMYGYFRCADFPELLFMADGRGYFDTSIPQGQTGNRCDNIDFVQKVGLDGWVAESYEAAVDWLIEAGSAAITWADAAEMEKTWRPPVPHKDKYEALRRIHGFMSRQGISRSIVKEWIEKKNVFADEHLNIVFVIRDWQNNIIGHELINWNGFYIPPTDFDGELIDGCMPPTWDLGIDPYNIVPPRTT